MSSDLERRLERALASLPGPDRVAETQAKRAALDALPRRSPRRRRFAIAGLGLAAALVLAGAALGLAGRLDVRLGSAPKRTPAAPVVRQALPAGATGFATLSGGRLWLATRTARMEMRASAATLSPRALYVAAGLGRSLVALAPDGTRAWRHAVGGRVVAISWAPYPTKIAYVASRRGRYELREIWGNGRHDRLLASGVRPSAPSWRADSQVLAYVTARGRLAVIDWRHGVRRVLRPGSCLGRAPVRSVVFARRGALLAVATGPRVGLLDPAKEASARCLVDPAARFTSVAWLANGDLVTTSTRGRLIRLQPVAGRLASVASVGVAGDALDQLVVSPDGRRLAVRVVTAARSEIWAVAAPVVGDRGLRRQRVLLTTPPGGIAALSWR